MEEKTTNFNAGNYHDSTAAWVQNQNQRKEIKFDTIDETQIYHPEAGIQHPGRNKPNLAVNQYINPVQMLTQMPGLADTRPPSISLQP